MSKQTKQSSIKKRVAVLSSIEQTNVQPVSNYKLEQALEFQFRFNKDNYKALEDMSEAELVKAYKILKSKQLTNQIEIQRFNHLLLTNTKVLESVEEVIKHKQIELPIVAEFIPKQYQSKDIHV